MARRGKKKAQRNIHERRRRGKKSQRSEKFSTA
jgi:hypothetical protein